MSCRPDRNRHVGMLLGAAVGDALGMPFQFLPPQVIREFQPDPPQGYRRAPEGHANHALSPGQFTDETQLMTLVTEVLLQRGAADPGAVAAAILRLHQAGEWVTPGRSLLTAGRRLERGHGWHDSGIWRDSGKPLAMIPPLVVRFGDAPDPLLHHGTTLARILLIEPNVLRGCSCFALLLRQVLRTRDERDLPQAVMGAATYIRPWSAPFAEILEWLPGLCGIDTREGLEELGTGTSVLECLPAALFAFLKHPRDFGAAVGEVVWAGDASDTTGFLTGALFGAFNGLEAIPQTLVDGLAESRLLLDLAGRLADAQSV